MLKQFPSKSNQENRTASSEYSRILSAAVINSKFRDMLLSDPLRAVSCGYSGEQFELNHEDKNRLATIHATSLAEFAAELSRI